MFPYYIQYVSIGEGGFVRTMKLTFDYKIKFSEKVYTYILQKKRARVHLTKEDQLPTTLIHLRRGLGINQERGTKPILWKETCTSRSSHLPLANPNLAPRKEKGQEFGCSWSFSFGGTGGIKYTRFIYSSEPGGLPTSIPRAGEEFCFGGDTKTRLKASLAAVSGVCGQVGAGAWLGQPCPRSGGHGRSGSRLCCSTSGCTGSPWWPRHSWFLPGPGSCHLQGEKTLTFYLAGH